VQLAATCPVPEINPPPNTWRAIQNEQAEDNFQLQRRSLILFRKIPIRYNLIPLDQKSLKTAFPPIWPNLGLSQVIFDFSQRY
jgi:hypothetical protein